MLKDYKLPMDEAVDEALKAYMAKRREEIGALLAIVCVDDFHDTVVHRPAFRVTKVHGDSFH